MSGLTVLLSGLIILQRPAPATFDASIDRLRGDVKFVAYPLWPETITRTGSSPGQR